ncbi:Por secretion system C-terminal sorting domain-containing protein [Reichenbachiella faecimaris]|uniref:Por secretion system C-terminal sorting domain-containing protein n=2 Tax=Reichenbachiella faecimaris TaxID=692418 RepID=A0A1W2G675_REIFA|nr:Por secretion system C-terminal sorting domain-containing protein [Reichenbachiella faecimaris]
MPVMHALLVCVILPRAFAQTTVISHDFNGSDNGWTVTSNTNGDWLRGSGILDAGSDGSYWHTSPSAYNNDAVLIVESGTLDFSGFTNLVLQVDVRYTTEDGYDGMQMEYNDGGGWSLLGAVGDGFNWYNETDLDAIGADEDGWSGDNETWETAIISLPAALENNSTVQFRFRFESDGGLTDEGVAFDNLTVVSGGSDIYVAGNGTEIKNGDSTPSTTDDTDFRSVGIGAGSKVKTYTIINLGGSTLSLTGASPVTIEGTHASDFSVDAQPASLTLSGGESTTFSIAFDPSATGVRSADISIASDDSNEDPFTFDIQGTGVNEIVYHSFDAGNEGWTVTDNTNGDWARGTAALSEGADGSFWYTTPAGAYNANAVLTIQSPVIDLSGESDLVLYIDLRYDTEADWDGFRIEYSSDGGTGWNDLGAVGDGINWYNDTDVDAIADGQDGWSGDNDRWETAEIELPAILENNTNTRYRVSFQSDVSENETGVAFDNFMISVGVPDIYVEGNSLEIINGAAGTSNLKGTNFRNVDVTSGTKSNSFTISNVGGGTLNLTGGTPVTISGTHAADFTVTSQPASSALDFTESTTFTIQFDPSATGTRSATVSIASDDSDEDPYTFAIAGEGDNAIVYYTFDASDEGWTVTSNTNGDWLRGNAILATGADGNYWHTDPSNYSNNAVLTIQSPVIDLTGETSLSLHIDLRYSTEAEWDGYQIEYSDDAGANWYNLGKYLDDINWYNDTDVDALADGEDGWSGDNGSWEVAETDLPAVLEDNSQVQFRILFASDGSAVDVGAAFDNFAIYGDVLPLPVELISFKASQMGDLIRLSWVTASELNNDHFDVQRSNDGVDFETIGTVQGHGTSNIQHEYLFNDRYPLTDVAYYRLIQYDFDGAFEIHKTVRIEQSSENRPLQVLAYPNPSLDRNTVNLRVNAEEKAKIIIQIISITGETVFSEVKTLETGGHDLKLYFNTALIPGMYALSVNQGIERNTTKLVVR